MHGSQQFTRGDRCFVASRYKIWNCHLMLEKNNVGLWKRYFVFIRFLPNSPHVVQCYSHKAFCGTYSQDGELFLTACQGKCEFIGRLLIISNSNRNWHLRIRFMKNELLDLIRNVSSHRPVHFLLLLRNSTLMCSQIAAWDCTTHENLSLNFLRLLKPEMLDGAYWIRHLGIIIFKTRTLCNWDTYW